MLLLACGICSRDVGAAAVALPQEHRQVRGVGKRTCHENPSCCVQCISSLVHCWVIGCMSAAWRLSCQAAMYLHCSLCRRPATLRSGCHCRRSAGYDRISLALCECSAAAAWLWAGRAGGQGREQHLLNQCSRFSQQPSCLSVAKPSSRQQLRCCADAAVCEQHLQGAVLP